ncbi:hypothetical protein ACOMHN_060114 [Nucella lapillus]
MMKAVSDIFSDHFKSEVTISRNSTVRVTSPYDGTTVTAHKEELEKNGELQKAVHRVESIPSPKDPHPETKVWERRYSEKVTSAIETFVFAFGCFFLVFKDSLQLRSGVDGSDRPGSRGSLGLISNRLPPQFSHWARGQPDNSHQHENGEDCVELQADGTWNDLWCEDFQDDARYTPSPVCELP